MAKVVYKVEDDVSTDIIYPGRYMATVLADETPAFCFADDADFNQALTSGKIPHGSVIVGGENFGCGSSREQAASTLKGHEVVIIAKSFARIFSQNAINLGLRTVTCPEIKAEIGDELEITPEQVLNKTSGKRFEALPIPKARLAIVEAGGLVAYAREKLLRERGPRA